MSLQGKVARLERARPQSAPAGARRVEWMTDAELAAIAGVDLTTVTDAELEAIAKGGAQ
jgi:hypothetical protein